MKIILTKTHPIGEPCYPSQCTLFNSIDFVINRRNRATITPHDALSLELKNAP